MATATEPTTTITIRVPLSLRQQLDQLAPVLEGIRAADAGDFATEQEVERVIALIHQAQNWLQNLH